MSWRTQCFELRLYYRWTILENAKIRVTHPTDQDPKLVEKQRDDCRALLHKLCAAQCRIMPAALDYVEESERQVSQPASAGLVELEPLHLPFSFDAEVRVKLKLLVLAKTEGDYQQGWAYSLILALRDDVKNQAFFNEFKRQNGGSVAENACSTALVWDCERF